MARVQLSKKQRFDVFKRDEFVCQYCGRKPPAVVLEVDHVHPVSEGGTNVDHNLITSCQDCNSGKGAGTLEVIPLDLAKRAELIAERLAQTKAYEAMLKKQKRLQDKDIDKTVDIWRGAFTGWTLKDKARVSIKLFLEKLPPSEVFTSMELACDRISEDRDRAYKYFCGVCWHKIRGERPTAHD